jgi:hypothetical protein
LARITKAEITPEAVRKWGQQDESFWQQLAFRQHQDQMMVEREGAHLRLEQNERDVHQVFSNDAKVAIFKASSMFAKQAPRILMPIRSGADGQMKSATQKTEDLTRFMWEEFARRYNKGLNNNFKYDMWQMLFLRGQIAGRILRNPIENDPFFWQLTLADPMTVKPRWSTNGLSRVTHTYYLTGGEISDEFFMDEEDPDWLSTSNPDTRIRVYAYYDRHFMAVTTDKTDGWIKEPTEHEITDENGNPIVPWVIRMGSGAFYHDTMYGSATWQKYVGESLLGRIRDQVANKEQMLAILHDIIEKQSEPPMVAYTNADKDLDIDTRSGARNVFAPQDKLEPISTNPNVQDLSALLTSYQTMIDRGGLDPILFGQGDPQLSGLAASAMEGNAQDVFTPYVLAMQDFQHQVTKIALQIFANAGTSMSIIHTDANSGRRLQGTQVSAFEVMDSGNYVEFNYENWSPQDKVAMGNLAAVLARDKLVSLETARREYLNQENPTLENTRVLSEMAFQDPAMVKMASALSINDLLQGMNMDIGQMSMLVQQISMMGQPPGAPPGGPPQHGPPGPGGGPAPGQPGSGQAPPGAPPQMPPNVLPPEMGANALVPNGAPLGPMGSVGANPNAQNIQQAPLF